MSANTAAAVGFKGRMMTLTVLEISSLDLAVVEQGLVAHVQKSPDFFRNMPVLLSLPNAPVDLPALVALVRGQSLVPVALTNPSAELAQQASAAGLGVINSTRGEVPAQDKPQDQAEAQNKQRHPQAKPEVGSRQSAAPNRGQGPAAAPTRVVSQPVRSGQQIYARNADLIVLAAVSEGAEIIADGHIHVYGTLRGRALAGASGDANARIFCRRFEAELVAVAGCYKVAEDMQESVRGKPVQVSLAGDNLLMESQE